MLVKDIVYDGILRLIRNFTTDSDNFEPYYNGHNDDEQNLLIEMAEKISVEYQRLSICKDSAILCPIEQVLYDIADSIKDKFPNYPDGRIDELRLLLRLFAYLHEYVAAGLNLEADFDIEILGLIESPNIIYEQAFVYDDAIQLGNALVLFSLEKAAELYTLFDDNTPSLDLLLCFMSKIGQEKVLLNSQYILINNGLSANSPKAWAYAALHLVQNGKIAHIPHSYRRQPAVSASKQLIPTENYHQFKDVITILSEYNSQEDILDKFLRLYHVVENFMFKMPIVGLEWKHDGNPFSFRDFQRLYTAINKSEIQALQKLNKRVFERQYNSTTHVLFKTYIFNDFTAKIGGAANQISVSNINHLLSYLRIYKKEEELLQFSDIGEENMYRHYSAIIYGIRNSLVHNKETEFHLTHEVLLNHFVVGDTVKCLIEEFLLPTMEEIVFNLLTDVGNDVVWFKNSKLALWQDV